MATILISYRDFLKNLAVLKFDSADAALHALGALPEEFSGHAISSQADVAALPVSMRVGLINALRIGDEPERKAFKPTSDRDDLLVERLARAAIEPTPEVENVKHKEGRKVPEPKHGMVYTLKVFVTHNPNATDAEVVEHLKANGTPEPSVASVKTFRGMHVHSMRVLADLGLFTFPA